MERASTSPTDEWDHQNELKCLPKQICISKLSLISQHYTSVRLEWHNNEGTHQEQETVTREWKPWGHSNTSDIRW